MKIVLLCGHQHNQAALAHKVAARFNLAGIVIEKKPAKKINSFSIPQLFNRLLNRTIFSAIHQSWFGLLDFYRKNYPTFPAVATISVSNINDEATIRFLKDVRPDLVMVSGTAMVKKEVLSLQFPKGIINLHTGLSPYIKGGPNCTNWCIADEHFHLIGNTIMWIDAGIDSGDLICTEITALQSPKNLLDVHLQVMEHAHDLYIRAVEKIDADFSNCKRIKQRSITEGITYYSRQWNNEAKNRLLKNYKKLQAALGTEKYREAIKKTTTVQL